MGNGVSKLGPEVLAKLQSQTHFDKREIHQHHQQFLSTYPQGLSLSTLITIYQAYFPFGNPIPFANRMYGHAGGGTFEGYLKILSVMSRGRMDEKIEWMFGFWDANGDGLIGWDELVRGVKMVEALVGDLAATSPEELNDGHQDVASNGSSKEGPQPQYSDEEETQKKPIKDPSLTDAELKVFEIFTLVKGRLPIDKLEKLSIDVEEFKMGAKKDSSIIQSLLIYDGII